MARRRSRRARENPLKTRDKVLIGVGGATLLGIGIFLLTRSKDEKKGSGSSANKGGSNGGDQANKGGSNGGDQGPTILPRGPTDSQVYVPAKTITESVTNLSQQVECPQGFKWGGYDADNPNLPKCIPV